MIYTLELEIAKSRDTVAELYADAANWAAWQETLVGYQILQGGERANGTRTRIVNRFGKREIEIIETVEANRLPDELVCTYEAAGAWNRVSSRFTQLAPQRTRWVFETEFRCRGWLRIMSLLMPGMFKKASLKEMGAFRKFAESDA